MPAPRSTPRPTAPPEPGRAVRRVALASGFLAFLAVLATLGDPGITVDEPLDVRPGRTYVATLLREGPGFFGPEAVRKVFADNAEHPPLGRWLLGVASTLGEPFEPLLGGADPFGVHAGRLAPAACFGVLVALVALVAGRGVGPVGAASAAFGLVAMPRVFAHAHLGALDTFLALFWTAALVAAVRATGSPRPVRALGLAGLAWGLALLTKIHAWLLPPIVLAAALARLGPRRAVPGVAAWTAVGLATYLAGWPWLWYDTLARLRAYLGTGVQRLSIRVEYFGQVFLDRDVPWHYPWLYFAATVPVGLHLLGGLGLARAWRERRVDPLPVVAAGSIGLFLALFSTGVPVYDGERLFLVAFPLWAILVGRGFGVVWDRLGGRAGRGLLAALLAVQGWGLVATHPFGLSYYNELVGGLPGAERLGLERTYWGDAVDGVLLDELAAAARAGETAALVPTLHHIQAAAATTPGLAAKQVRMLDESAVDSADWLVVYRRTAYWRPGFAGRLAGMTPVAERSRGGVWLARLYRRETAAPP